VHPWSIKFLTLCDATCKDVTLIFSSAYME
jgi:hypothetical protein